MGCLLLLDGRCVLVEAGWVRQNKTNKETVVLGGGKC